MPACKAIKTFHSTQYGYIRAGTRFHSDKNYADQLRTRGLIEIIADVREASRAQVLQAPKIKAPHPDGIQVLPKKATPEPPPASDSAVPGDAGAAKPSALSRAARALQRQIAPTSKASAKR